MAAHETLLIREVKMPSDKAFGFVAVGAFTILSGIVFRKTGIVPWWGVLAVGFFLGLTLFRSSMLHPLNRMWMKFGMLLAKFMNPIVMGILFFAALSPLALLMRLTGRDALGLRFDRAARSYWKDRSGEKLTFESMKNQF